MAYELVEAAYHTGHAKKNNGNHINKEIGHCDSCACLRLHYKVAFR